MRTRLRLLLTLCAVPALIAGVLAITPAASAASRYVSVTSKTPAVYKDGKALVYTKCSHKSKTCTGKLSFKGGPATKFSIGRKSAKYVTVKLNKTTQATIDPWKPGGTGANNRKPATLVINEDKPSNTTHTQPVMVEKRQYSQTIRGRVSGTGPMPTDAKVTLFRASGLKTTRLKVFRLNGDGNYSFTVALGTNNSPTEYFRLAVSGVVDGELREWYYQSNGAARYIRDARGVRGVKDVNTSGDRAVVADFTYGHLTGRITGTNHPGGVPGATVRVAAVPIVWPSKTGDRRELDVPFCANDFVKATTDSSGDYSANFLPANGKFVVQVASTLKAADGKSYVKLWNNVRGTCIGAKGASTRVPVGGYSPVLDSSDAEITGDIDFKTTPTSNDRYLILRTNDANRTIVGQGHAAASGTYRFSNLAPGSYVMEYAKRTGCTGWYTSRYKNNYAYHSGEDRGNEKWKTVNGKYPEYKKSYQMGYVAKSPGKGKKGWMYRDHCKEAHAERTSNARQILGTTAGHSVVGVDTTLSRGATISGRVTRKGGKSNKEMLVTAYRKDNKYVARTAITDGSGRFKMYGLASGNWSIMVNADSWRGIGRSFSGKHSKSVSVGKGYSAGTLYAKF